MKIKTRMLKGDEITYALLISQGYGEGKLCDDGENITMATPGNKYVDHSFTVKTLTNVIGPIHHVMTEHMIGVEPDPMFGGWEASYKPSRFSGWQYFSGPTPVDAVAKALIHIKLGDEVEIPDFIKED